MELLRGAKWIGGSFEQHGRLEIDKQSSMVIDIGGMASTHVFKSFGKTVIDGTLKVYDQHGLKLDDNRILVNGSGLTGSGSINGKPVSAFGGTVTGPSR